MKITKLLAGCVFAAVTVISCKKKQDVVVNQLNTADNDFIKFASLSNSAEITTAKAAVLKSVDSVVLSFAQQILTTHTNSQEDLKIMGKVVGFAVNDTIDDVHAAIISQLDSLTGKAFDSTYMHNQLSENQTAMNLCEEEINKGAQINVKAYANTLLQSLQADYVRADTIVAASYK